jgi:colicin import membrane protein
MKRKLTRKYPGLGGMIACSFLLHTLCFLIISRGHFLAGVHNESPVYYVEMVNLPVAAPQAGSPTATGKNEALARPTPPAPSEMLLPRKAPLQTMAKAPAKPVPHPTSPAPQPDAAREFEERLARLAQDADARHMATALERAKQKAAAGKGKAGMPGATGNEAGSDYPNYLQSRLKDALQTTIAYQTKNPLVRVKLTIGRTGRIIKYVVEQSSGDRMFEDAVTRAIAKAEKNFPPPPGQEDFEQGFVFRPQGVGKN